MFLNTVQENSIKEFLKTANEKTIYNDLYFSDLLTLTGKNWLNDNVIDKYYSLIVERSGKSVHAFSTHFFPKLNKDGYNSVSRWTKEINLFSFQLILVSVFSNSHWTLAVINVVHKEIRHYDSLNCFNKNCLEVLQEYVKNEENRLPVLKSIKWRLTKAKDIPKQSNMDDCGVFICKYADYLSLNKDMTFNQTQIPSIRKAIIWEIINKKLLN